MRWINRKPIQNKLGDRRSRVGFLWWPLKIEEQTRWLERAAWEEECQQEYFSDFGIPLTANIWIPVEWKS